jgi:hypothetical protein
MRNQRIRWGLAVLGIAGLSVMVRAQSYPMTLDAYAEVAGPNKPATASFVIHLDGLMQDDSFRTVADALKSGGIPRFLPALRALPAIGYIELANTRTDIKYARVRSGDALLVIGTDQPIHFVRGGVPEAKPKAGYDVGVIELKLDAQGNGFGLMAAAARVKPAVDGSLLIDDYADAQIRLAVKLRK